MLLIAFTTNIKGLCVQCAFAIYLLLGIKISGDMIVNISHPVKCDFSQIGTGS